jgi:hypothetical protein
MESALRNLFEAAKIVLAFPFSSERGRMKGASQSFPERNARPPGQAGQQGQEHQKQNDLQDQFRELNCQGQDHNGGQDDQHHCGYAEWSLKLSEQVVH